MELLRTRLEAIVNDPKTTPRDVVAASREYRIVVAELAKTAPAPKAGAPKSGTASTLDEIAARRRKRGA
ncbi:hypothetical protein H5P33_21150 [Mycolicibacterium arabiense]|nr:hypothetical protein [Mycolicibacterium arabiense]